MLPWGQWHREKEYVRGHGVHFGQRQLCWRYRKWKYWYCAIKDLPAKSHKKPRKSGLEESQWVIADKTAAGPGFAEIETDIALLICNYFSLEFGEFKNCARTSCKFIVLKDAESLDLHQKQMEGLHNSIFATFLMTSAIVSFLKNELESSPVASCTFSIAEVVAWDMHIPWKLSYTACKHCQTIDNILASGTPEQKRIDLVFLHEATISNCSQKQRRTRRKPALPQFHDTSIRQS